jgi:hypothetical protein
MDSNIWVAQITGLPAMLHIAIIFFWAAKTSAAGISIGLLQDLSEVVKALSILDLSNDLNVLAIRTENLTDSLDVLTTTDKRSKNHVDIVLDTKSEIGLVFFGECREINVGIREVDAFLGGNLSIVSGTSTDGLVVDNFEDVKGENSVVDVDDATSLNDLGDVLVVNEPEKSA